MNRSGNPSLVTWLTGAMVTPMPCVYVNRSLMKVRVGSDAVFSSRAETCTCRYRPSIMYRSSPTDTKS